MQITAAMSTEIRDVWEGNIEEEFKLIRKIVVDYPYIAMVRAALNMAIF